jgi:Type I phosphodiesterase / nucleotide pyrophosphatase
MTNVALSAMLGATPPAGYESLYFDRSARELRGGIRKYLGRRTPDKVPSSYMDDLDYQEPLPFEFLIYVAPESIWRADMGKFRERFRAAPPDRDYFAFLKATDGLLHSQGPARLAVALESLDKILHEVRDHCGSETEIVMFSDHGMNLEENRRAPLKSTLLRRGFQLVIPAFGLCSYVAIYCDEQVIPEVARATVEVEGVDFAVYKDQQEVVIESERGKARIESQSGWFRYLAVTGDPLELGQLDHGLKPDKSWFEETASHKYPDAVPNVYKSLFTPRVQHTADILVSLKDGYYYGWSPFGKLVNLLATHGNALQSSSNAFLMSTHRQFPAYVRADDAKVLLRE